MAKYYFDLWECDPDKLTLRKGEYEVRLEKRVMGVLVLLLENAQEVVAANTLFKQVWAGVVVGDNTLHRSIRLIRKALGDSSRKPVYVESVPRKGYRFKLPVEKSDQVEEPAGRLSVLVTLNSELEKLRSDVALREISRLMGLYSPALRVLRRASPDEIQFQVHIEILDGHEGQCEFRWELLQGRTQEILSSGSHRELITEFPNKAVQVYELLSTAAAMDLLRRWVTSIKRLQPSMDCSYWDCIIIADRYRFMDEEHLSDRRSFLEKAMALEPALPYAMAAYADFLSWLVANGGAEDPKNQADLARSQARRALEIDGNEPYTLSRCGRAFSRLGDYEEGVLLSARAIGFASSAEYRLLHADALSFAGKFNEALAIYQELLSGTPSGRSFQYGKIVVPLVQLGLLEQAKHYVDLAVVHFPRDFFCWSLKANLEALAGQMEDATSSLAHVFELQPELTLERLIEGTRRTYAQNEMPAQSNLTKGLLSLM